MRSLVFGKRWRKAGEGTSGKNKTDCSGKRRILRKHVKRNSMETEACCLEKRKFLRKRERRISEDEEADCPEKRNGVTCERYHSGAENAARCMCWRSTLHRLAQRAASAIAPHCVSRLPLLLHVPRRHRLLRQAPLSYPARAPDIIGRGCKEEAPSCSFPVRKVQEGALLYPVTLHSSAHLSLKKGAAWSGHSV